jgi:type II secretory pathway pseudopilin PulG
VAACCRRLPGADRRGHRCAAAFSVTELLVVIGIVSVLAGILLAVISSSRRAASGVACAANLRQVHAAFLRYLDENDGRYPDTFVSGVSWEQMLRKYIAGAENSDSGAFRCPADPELFSAVGSSYDWRDTGRANTTLAGRPRSDRHRTDAVLAFDALPGWHARDRMTAVRLDGAALSMLADECLSDLQRSVRVGG